MMHENNRKRLTIGTFNVRGLNDENKQDLLSKDIEKYKLDICCLQETKLQKSFDQDIGKKDFIVSEKWKNNVIKYWKVSDRLAVIQLELKEKRICLRSKCR